jgi:hypothetical protein
MVVAPKTYLWFVPPVFVGLVIGLVMSACSVSSTPNKDTPSQNYKDLYQSCLDGGGSFTYHEDGVDTNFGCEK